MLPNMELNLDREEEDPSVDIGLQGLQVYSSLESVEISGIETVDQESTLGSTVDLDILCLASGG